MKSSKLTFHTIKLESHLNNTRNRAGVHKIQNVYHTITMHRGLTYSIIVCNVSFEDLHSIIFTLKNARYAVRISEIE